MIRIRPTEILKNEHRLIERVLSALTTARQKLENGESVQKAVFEESLDFIKNFADRCHHAKEEKILFPEMEKCGIPVEGGPIGVMLAEHEEGRKYVKAMSEAMKDYDSAQSRKTLIDNAKSYANFLSQHIPKEDTILYPMADEIIPEAEQKEIVEKFERMENEVMVKESTRSFMRWSRTLK